MALGSLKVIYGQFKEMKNAGLKYTNDGTLPKNLVNFSSNHTGLKILRPLRWAERANNDLSTSLGGWKTKLGRK